MDLPKNLEKHWSEEFKSLMNYYPKTGIRRKKKKNQSTKGSFTNSDLYCLDQPFGNWFEHARVNTYDLCIGHTLRMV